MTITNFIAKKLSIYNHIVENSILKKERHSEVIIVMNQDEINSSQYSFQHSTLPSPCKL